MSSQDEGMGYEKIVLEKSDQVSGLLESRHISDDEVRIVIYNAETTGEKLYQPGTDRLLAKLKIANATFYAEYSPASEGTYVVHTAYSHRTTLEE
ncbi:MAG: hypothetical protein AB1603_04450 [Chloroflexota bacterium]